MSESQQERLQHVTIESGSDPRLFSATYYATPLKIYVKDALVYDSHLHPGNDKSTKPRKEAQQTEGKQFSKLSGKNLIQTTGEAERSEQQEWATAVIEEILHTSPFYIMEHARQNWIRIVENAHNAALEKRDRIVMDSQSWGDLQLEWRESDGRHYLYDEDGNLLWSGEPSYNIWRCVKLTQELAAERQRREQANIEHDDIADALVTANRTIKQLAAKSHERRDQLMSAQAALKELQDERAKDKDLPKV